MKCSDAGLEFIMAHEGCVLHAYPDPATGGEPWTIGVGHTGGVKRGDTCTKEQAMEWLRQDVAWAEKCLANSVKGNLTQNQIDACLSLIFNIGCGNFGKSSVLRELNDGNDMSAAQAFGMWNKAGGKVIAGLTKRRQEEMNLFLA